MEGTPPGGDPGTEGERPRTPADAPFAVPSEGAPGDGEPAPIAPAPDAPGATSGSPAPDGPGAGQATPPPHAGGAVPPYPPNYWPYPGYPGYAPPPAPPAAERRGGVPWYLWLIGGVALVALIGCGSCAALVFALSRTASIVAHETPVSATSSQSFAVSGTPHLVVHDPTGQVIVQTGAAGSVALQVTKTARDTSTAAAQRDLAAITVSATQDGDDITIVVGVPEGGGTFGRQLAADLTLTVPATTDLDASGSAGALQVNGVVGRIDATLSAGDVQLTDVTLDDGSRIDLSAGTLNWSGSLANGASANVTVSTGAVFITLPPGAGVHLDATTSLGGITIEGWDVPVKQSGLGASAAGDLGAGAGGTLAVHVSTGSIALTSQ